MVFALKARKALLSKIICPSVSSPRACCLSDGFGSVSRMRLPVLLSKRSYREERPLRGGRGKQWTFKRRIEPRPQIPIGQQVKAEQSGEVRKTPGPRGLELQKFQQQHRNQGDPDLHLDGVLTGAHECF